jgi:hypothetical protein
MPKIFQARFRLIPLLDPIKTLKQILNPQSLFSFEGINRTTRINQFVRFSQTFTEKLQRGDYFGIFSRINIKFQQVISAHRERSLKIKLIN